MNQRDSQEGGRSGCKNVNRIKSDGLLHAVHIQCSSCERTSCNDVIVAAIQILEECGVLRIMSPWIEADCTDGSLCTHVSM